jgi:hypothetical protein
MRTLDLRVSTTSSAPRGPAAAQVPGPEQSRSSHGALLIGSPSGLLHRQLRIVDADFEVEVLSQPLTPRTQRSGMVHSKANSLTTNQTKSFC